MPSDTSNLSLETLNKWNNKMTEEGLLLHRMQFDKKFTEFKDMKRWFGETDKYDEKDIFFKFATDEYGSIYYLWFYPKLKGEPPVVTHNLSDNSADSVTDNITDFVCSFIQGKTLSGGKVYNEKSSNFHVVEEYKTQAAESLNCEAKPKVFFGLKKHPKFDKWLDKLDEKYQN